MIGGVPGTRISLCGGSEVCCRRPGGRRAWHVLYSLGPGKSVGAAGKRLRESFASQRVCSHLPALRLRRWPSILSDTHG